MTDVDELNVRLRLGNAAERLGREFPGHSFRTVRLRGRLKLAAERKDGAAGPHTLVSEDPEEIRAELASYTAPQAAS